MFIENKSLETSETIYNNLLNELPIVRNKWSFTFKRYRNNAFLVEKKADGTVEKPKVMDLYTLSLSYLNDSTIVLINDESGGVFSSNIETETQQDLFTILKEHVIKGAMSSPNKTFDFFISQKLKSQWTNKQTIRGEEGQIYEFSEHNYVIKTCNIFLHGNYKGLLVQIELNDVIDKNDRDMLKKKIEKICEKFSFSQKEVFCCMIDPDNSHFYLDLCLQYSKIFNF